MNINYVLFFTALILLFKSGVSAASDINEKLQSAFGGQSVVINDYDGHLKEIIADSKVYFATHDGQYIFAGPILNTHQQEDIVSVREGVLRQSYLNGLPESTFINYPSNGSSRYEITVVTDIDCPYCRTLHTHIPKINELGISVNYIMLPRAGIGSSSYVKTDAALCSNKPAESITSAMQNKPTKPISCENSVLNKHMEIVKELRINSTPTIILPSGKLNLGLLNPDQLVALLEKDELRRAK